VSRTNRGTRPAGHDFWSKRPPSNKCGAGGSGPSAKKRTASIERQQAKHQTAKEFHMNEITSRLENWIREQVTNKEFILWGNVFDDMQSRWPDNTIIHTSGIYNCKLHEGSVVRTRNSTYLLGKEYTDESNSEKESENRR
jgi:hypothetical protein